MRNIISTISIYLVIIGCFSIAFGAIDGNLIQMKDNLYYIDFGFYISNFARLGNQFDKINSYWNLFANFTWGSIVGQLIKLPFILLYYVVIILCYIILVLQYIFTIILPFGDLIEFLSIINGGLISFLNFVQSMGW